MNELVRINYDTSSPTVLGRDLHAALKIGTPYNKWFPRMCEYGFEADKDYVILVGQKCPTNNPKNPWTEVTDHQLTLDMAKEICMIQRSEIGKKCREYFIAVEKAYREKQKSLSPAEFLLEQAKMFVEQERRINTIENKVSILEAKVETRPENCYTIAGYASLRGKRIDVSRANMLGRKAAKLSKEYGYEISQTHDPRFGSVNVYHADILKEVFSKTD